MTFFARLEYFFGFHRLDNEEIVYDSQFWQVVRYRKVLHFIAGLGIFLSIYVCFIPALFTVTDENPELSRKTLSNLIEIPSDLITAFCYFLIPFMLLYIINKRNDVPFNSMFVMFSLFIFCCGMTHLLQVFHKWFSLGLAEAVVFAKFLTSGVSFGTAIVLLKAIPLALRLPSRQQLEHEIAARISAQQKLGEQYRRALLLRSISENLRQSLRVQTILSTACSEIREAVKASRCIVVSNMDDLSEVEAENNYCVPSVRSLPPFSASEHPLFAYCLSTPRAVLIQENEVSGDSVLKALFQQWQIKSLVIIRASHIEKKLIMIHHCLPTLWTFDNISLIEDIVSGSLQPCLVQASLVDSEQKREIAERSSQAKSEFLATISHEIRTPMNAILGTVQIIRDSNLTPEQSECLKIVSSNGKSLLSLLNLLLDFSRIESQSFSLDNSPFNLHHAISKSTMLLSKNARNISLNISPFPANLPTFVIGDKIRLRQIFVNLISNAIKFTEQGEIKVSAKVLDNIPCSENFPNGGHHLQFDVKDTGIGIPRDQQSLLFKPFSQVDSSLTRRYEGTGLGLAICSKLTERMGGKIWVNSTYGVGSTFSFTIKVQRVAQGYQHPASSLKQQKSLSSVAQKTDVKILLAEDNAVNQMVALRLLEKIGYKNVHTVSNGKEAIKMLEKEKHDIILMDLHMPEMDGITATTEIRKNPEFRQKPYIIAVTANVQESTKKNCLKAGMNDFIEKPFKLSLLNELLQKATVNSV